MQNVKAEVKGKKLIITVDLDGESKPSASGKTVLLGSSGGNQIVGMVDGQPVFMGLNVYRKP